MRLLPLGLLGVSCATAPRALGSAEPVIYMVMTDRFADGDVGNDGGVNRAEPGAYHGGDFRGLRGKLPYLAELGVDLLWISPVVDNIDHPVPSGRGFLHWGFHGYWAKDFETTEEHFGSAAELRALVDAAHAHGLGVLIDVVLNHPGYGSPFSARADWTRAPARGDCGSDELTRCLSGLPDFRTERPEVAEYLVRVHANWAARTGCDGFRVDAAKHVDHDVWRKLRQAVDRVRPGFRLLGEVWGASAVTTFGDPWLRAGEMDLLFDFSFSDQAFDFVSGAQDARRLDQYLQARAARTGRYVHYLDTHDVPGFLARVGGDKAKMKLAAALELTVPGLPLIYYGDEVARPTGDWPQNRTDMPWGAAQDRDLYDHYRRLLAARRHFWGPLEPLHVEGARYGFRRGPAVVLLNAGPNEWVAILPASGRFRDAVSGARAERSFRVAAGQAAVLLPAEVN
ncbi:MAG TPA: alpha-amylase family glycosyl hydrolase [Polyangia bacterium]|nr:alpha-amylase family glycosyl hydrolase [Polyangia bacterium]